MSTTRIAILGLDHWYSVGYLAETFAKHIPGVELAAIVDLDKDRAHQIADPLGVTVRDTYREVIDDDTIDAVATFASSDQNAANVIAAAAAGKHIFSVKPMARTLDEATQIVHAVEDAGVVFLGGDTQFRFWGVQQTLRRLVRSRIGDVVSIHFNTTAPLPSAWPGSDNVGWFADPDRVPGGGWIDHAIYNFDTINDVVGGDVVEVSGTAANLRFKDLAVEDWGTAVVKYDNGVIATIHDDWIAPPADDFRQRQRHQQTYVGTEGTVSYDTATNHVLLLTEAGWEQVPLDSEDFVGAHHFVDMITGRAEPVSTVRASWRNLANCLAYYESIAAERAVAPRRLDDSNE